MEKTEKKEKKNVEEVLGMGEAKPRVTKNCFFCLFPCFFGFLVVPDDRVKQTKG